MSLSKEGKRQNSLLKVILTAYVSNIRKPHVWGGEPELFMASHVLQMPITVYMYDRAAGGLISIAEYGQVADKLPSPDKVMHFS